MDLTPYAAVTRAEGPFATVVIDTSRTTEDALTRIETRWRQLSGELVEAGADAATVDALASEVLADRGIEGEHGIALVAAGGKVLLDETVLRAPAREVARWSPLPDLMPLVAAHADVVPHVVVVADRVGADVTVHGAARTETYDVEGGELDVSRTKGGGWRFQHVTEDVWDKNGAQVADVVNTVVRTSRAQLLVAAGDVHALGALEKHLDAQAAAVLQRIEEGGRAAGADHGAIDTEVDRLVAQTAAGQLGDVLDLYRQRAGSGGDAVDGLAAVVGALRRSQVDTVLLVDDPTSTTTLWAGADPLVLALTRSEVTDLGEEEPFEERADAVIVRALAASDAALVTVPGTEVDLDGGVGALLRYADASTPL